MAAALDEAVGEVFDALKAGSSYQNSVIVYTSDNGAQGGQGGTSYPLKVGFVTSTRYYVLVIEFRASNLPLRATLPMSKRRDGRRSCLRGECGELCHRL